ncbi:MAG: AsmA family protein [Desulfobacula sp.]|nr:AsmA family protein [Desulfobacula sp.]
MKSILKWLLIIGGIFFVFVIAAMIIIPKFVDIKKYKPVIEEKVAEATGRSFSLGDDIDLSIFPWVGIKLTNVKLGNPKGFGRNQMISVEKFEVRLKVLPLLSRQIEVKTFALTGPQIYLEKLKDGTANWEGFGQEKGPDVTKEKSVPESENMAGTQGLPITDLKVDNFSITNGKLIYIDQATGVKKEISDLNLNLADISLDRPINIKFNAKLDNNPISLIGTAGPIGKEPGKGTMNLDFELSALEQLNVKIKGYVIDPSVLQNMDIQIDMAPFSPRKLFAALDQDFPVKTQDPKALDNMSFKVRIKGNLENISLLDGALALDDSKLKFSATAKELTKPNLKFDLQLDRIDLDRYLPEPGAKEKAIKTEGSKKKTDPEKKIDYAPLRKLVLDGKIQVGQMKVSGAGVEDIRVHILAKNGVITIDPMDLKLYKGSVNSKVVLNVQQNSPKTKVTLDAKGIQAGPLLKDAMNKDLIEGTLVSILDISIVGDTPGMIKKTLTGKGELRFNDGAIIGIDLAGSVRNIKSKFGVGEKSAEKPRTDFAELKIPFTAKNGLVTIDGTGLASPLLRVLVDGKVNLPKELLNLRVEPKFVATLKGQGDSKQRSGLMLPVLITGNFGSPKIRPDLKGLIGGGLDTESLKNKILGSGGDSKTTIETQKEDIKKVLQGFLPGFGD